MAMTFCSAILLKSGVSFVSFTVWLGAACVNILARAWSLKIIKLTGDIAAGSYQQLLIFRLGGLVRTVLYVTGMTLLSAINQWSAAMIDVARASAFTRAMKANPDLAVRVSDQKAPIGFRANENETTQKEAHRQTP